MAWAAMKAKMQTSTIIPPAPAAVDASFSACPAAAVTCSTVALGGNATGAVPARGSAAASTRAFWAAAKSRLKASLRAGFALCNWLAIVRTSTAFEAARNCGAQVKKATAQSPSEAM